MKAAHHHHHLKKAMKAAHHHHHHHLNLMKATLMKATLTKAKRNLQRSSSSTNISCFHLGLDSGLAMEWNYTLELLRRIPLFGSENHIKEQVDISYDELFLFTFYREFAKDKAQFQ